MSLKNSAYVYIDGANRSADVVMPVKWANFLDERLDECRISLRAVEDKTFSPLTPVEIIYNTEVYYGVTVKQTVEKYSATRHYVIANDSVTEMRVGSGLYNHDLYLIEVTKVAECVVVDTLTFTNDLGRNYAANASYAQPEWA